MIIDAALTPSDIACLPGRDLGGITCVVFDILRATSSMVTALANGSIGIIPVATIAEAIAWRQREPACLLAGEREGVRIQRALTCSVDFDLGNSPREFTSGAVKGRIIVMTTTNGTRALKACQGAREVWLGSFLNLEALAARLLREPPAELKLVCSGTFEEASYEDILGAGALCDLLWPAYQDGRVSDSANIARELYRAAAGDLLGAMRFARNGRRLLAMPDLAADVPVCLQRGFTNLLAGLDASGCVRASGRD
jgi:2-phosphosulfolactate phosphatase